MPIVAGDLEYYKSANSNSTGGAIDATAITDNTLNNLFDDVSSDEASAGANEYRKAFVKNNHGSLSWLNVALWRSANTTSTTEELWLGLGTATDDDGSNELTAFTGAAKVALVSDGADTRVVTVIGEVAGVRTSENVTLNGTTEVLTTNTFDSGRVYIVYPASSSATRIITIKQGTGGTIRGTIGLNKLSCICYFNVTAKADGIELGNIAAGGSQGFWIKRAVDAGTTSQTSNSGTIKCEGETT